MLTRNTELRRAPVIVIAVTLVIAAFAGSAAERASLLGYHTEARDAAFAGTILGVGVAIIVFARLTRQRYRRLAELAERLDEALHAGRAVSLADMREGELAILASEIDKALTRLTITAEELARERASLADSLADISHQLKTPLTSLGLTLALMRREASAGATTATDANRDELLARIRTSEQLVEQVQWLVSALLKLARIDAGTVEFRHEHVDAARLVEGALAPLAIAFDLADVRVEREVQPSSGFLGDEAWCREALTNVLKNCLEHTPAGGSVRVSAREDAVAFRICVTDTGPGIAEEDLPHVFERFYRGQGADANQVNPTGVGIGLALARSLVTAQDGRIVAGNAANEDGGVAGARFDLTFFKATV